MTDNHTALTEPGTVSSRPVLIIAFGFLAFVALCLAGMFFYYRGAVGPRRFLKPEAFPTPQLQVTPVTDLEALKKKQLEQLRGYAWEDKAHTIVRIPIERAMQIVASKGAPAFAPMDTQSLDAAQVAAQIAGQAMENAGPAPPGAQK